MDLEGIDVAVLYPSRGLFVLAVDGLDSELAAAIARAYNDWMHDFCKIDPMRMYGAGITINRVTRLSPTEFREETASYLHPWDHRYATGIHTLVGDGSLTVVDGHRQVVIPALILRRAAFKLRRLAQVCGIGHIDGDGRAGLEAPLARELRVHRDAGVEDRDHAGPARKTRIEQVNKAVRKHDVATEMRPSEQEQRLLGPIHDLALYDVCKMSVAPVVHVLVGRVAYDRPVDRWVAEYHADLLADRQPGIQGADRFEHLLIHRRRPNTRDYRRVFPNPLELIMCDTFTGHIAVGNVLITSIAEFDDDVVDGIGELGVAQQLGEELSRTTSRVARLAERNERISLERVEKVVRRWRQSKLAEIIRRGFRTSARQNPKEDRQPYGDADSHTMAD